MTKRARSWIPLGLAIVVVLCSSCRAPWRSSSTSGAASNQPPSPLWDKGQWDEMAWS